MITRTAKLVPWYYATKPQCQAHIKRDDLQCSNSATYEGFPRKGTAVHLCRPHADMADFPVRPIREQIVIVRED